MAHEVMPAFLPNFYASSKIYTHNSLVGAITNADGPYLDLMYPDTFSYFRMFKNIGNKNPQVFPEPVLKNY
jgi:hypothetical protein